MKKSLSVANSTDNIAAQGTAASPSFYATVDDAKVLTIFVLVGAETKMLPKDPSVTTTLQSRTMSTTAASSMTRMFLSPAPRCSGVLLRTPHIFGSLCVLHSA